MMIFVCSHDRFRGYRPSRVKRDAGFSVGRVNPRQPYDWTKVPLRKYLHQSNLGYENV